MSADVLVASLGWTLLHFLWQGAVLGCLTAILLVALRNARPETRYAVACGALLLCIAWPLAGFASLLRAGSGDASGYVPTGAGAMAALSSSANSLPGWLQAHLGWIVALWAACTAALGGRMALGLVWIGRTAHAQSVDPVWQARLSQMARRFGLARNVRLRIVDTLSSPITAGWWRPVVLVPAALVAGMPPQLLEALLAHELGHIRRHDYLVNLVQNVIEALLFYHPAVWWISHRIRAEREQIADDFAARQLGAPQRLARALSELERLQFSHHHLAQAATGGDLLARIRRQLRPDVQALDWKAALPVLGLVLACAAHTHGLTRRDRVAPPAFAQTATSDVTRPAIADFDTCKKPSYPVADLAAGHEGTVTVSFLVNTDGSVSTSRILHSSGFATLDDAAQGAIAKCHFAPALLHGRATPQWTPVQYVWTLR
jgi:D-alanyl-D-alanine endopeptidase (penicillin-binding protein 7)